MEAAVSDASGVAAFIYFRDPFFFFFFFSFFIFSFKKTPCSFAPTGETAGRSDSTNEARGGECRGFGQSTGGATCPVESKSVYAPKAELKAQEVGQATKRRDNYIITPEKSRKNRTGD